MNRRADHCRDFQTPSSVTSRRPRVLLIDWDLHSRTIYGAMLQHRGFDVHVAERCELPPEREWPAFDVVLVDPATCEPAALDTVRERASRHGLPVLALTFHAVPHELEAIRGNGFDQVLLRPMAPHDLVDAVRQAIGTRQSDTDRASGDA